MKCVLPFPFLYACTFWEERKTSHVRLFCDFFCRSTGILSLFPRWNHLMLTVLVVYVGEARISMTLSLSKTVRSTSSIVCWAAALMPFQNGPSTTLSTCIFLFSNNRCEWCNDGRISYDSSGQAFIQRVHLPNFCTMCTKMVHRQPCLTKSIKASSPIFLISVLTLSFISSYPTVNMCSIVSFTIPVTMVP